MKQIISIIILFTTMQTYAQDERIIKTENLVIYDYNLLHYDNFKDKFKTPETSYWGKVSGDESGQRMIAMFYIDIFDYSIFNYFYEYKKFTPENKLELFEKEFLFKEKDIDPKITLSFLQYLYDYIKDDFAKDDYYFDIINLTNEYNSHSPVRIKINDKTIKFSTTHSSYKGKVENKDKIEITDESIPNETIKWENIFDGKIYEGDNEKIIIKKITYKELLDKLFNRLTQLCELADELNLKVNRNASW